MSDKTADQCGVSQRGMTTGADIVLHSEGEAEIINAVCHTMAINRVVIFFCTRENRLRNQSSQGSPSPFEKLSRLNSSSQEKKCIVFMSSVFTIPNVQIVQLTM